MKARLLALAIFARASIVLADPAVAVSEEPARKPPEATVPARPAPPPARPAPTLDGAPQPGDESGRTDVVDPGDSAFRLIARGALFVPKLAIEAVLSPIRGSLYLEEKYDLTGLYYRIFYNADRTIGLYPTATYESGFGASAGARFIDLDTFGEHEHLALQATTGAVTGELYRESFLASFKTGDRISHSFQLGLDANFDRRPADPFYGIGNGNLVTSYAGPIDARIDPTAVGTSHRYQEARVALSGNARVVDDLHVVATGSVADLEFARSTSGVAIDEVYAPSGLVGFLHGVKHAYGELELRYDSRARSTPWEPHDLHSTGSLAAVFVGRDHPIVDGTDFWRTGLELQHYWRFANGPRMLVTRFHGEAVSGGRTEVPFTELPMLGGGQFLRGYDFERFRDRVAAFGSVQYGWDVSHLVDAYVFTDAGRVFQSVDDVTYRGLRVGYGLGLELHGDAGFLMEGSIASSIDGGLFFSVSFNPVLDARARWR